MKVANIDSKTARTVSHEPINRTAKERRSKYTNDCTVMEFFFNNYLHKLSTVM